MRRRNFTQMMSLASMLMVTKKQNEAFCKKRIVPLPLKKGDTVALIAPGSPVKEEKFANAFQNMEALGLKVKYNPVIYQRTGYLAGDDTARLNDIHAMFSDKNVKAIWCLRGGYGCTRLIPYLDYNLIRKNPKILIGYSDITALLLAIHKQTGLIGFHGAVASSEIFSEYTFDTTQAMLFNHQPNRVFHTIIQDNEKYRQTPYTIIDGVASGEVIAGNLSLLVSMIGSKFEPSYKNKIVFIEEIGEKPYRVDRMLTQLIQSTDISHCAGIVWGVFNDCEAKVDENSFALKDVIIEKSIEIGKPCFYGFPFGHVGDITPIPIGIKGSINAAEKSCHFDPIFE